MKILLFAASKRKNSLNKKLIKQASKMLQDAGHTVDIADFNEFECPLYDQDTQDASGVAEGAKKLINRMKAADALVISSPEYNYSIPGTLKNLIDWVSRDRPMPWDGQKILLLTASPSNVGGNRGYWATRIPLEGCGSFVYPKTFALSATDQSFDANGNLTDPKGSDSLKKVLSSFADWAGKF
jgi:NAD(P)H-dependent FMN reductase